MIDRGVQVTVKRQAELLDLSRSSVYYTPRPLSERDLRLMRRIDELHLHKCIVVLRNHLMDCFLILRDFRQPVFTAHVFTLRNN